MNKFRTLTAREIECRVAQISKTGSGLSLLLYKDARCDQAILDETVGAMNWQRHHTRDNANCIVSIWDSEKSQWIDKEDTGTESNTEAEKGLASDSFKRACVNWGIGRELYTAPFIWISKADCEIKETDNGRSKYRCDDRFEVSEIGYNDHREINHLRIVNAKTHNTVYSYDEKPIKPAKGEDDEPRIKPATCERCGKIITGAVLPDGTMMAAHEIVGQSKIKFNGIYCHDCMQALEEKRPEQKPVTSRQAATAEQIEYIKSNASDADYMAIMTKYGANLERLTANGAAKVIKQIDANNKAVS